MPDVVIYPYFEIDFTLEYPAKRSDAPLVIIEIQSPSQSLDEMVDKANVYFEFGVKSCWIVQPRIKGVLYLTALIITSFSSTTIPCATPT